MALKTKQIGNYTISQMGALEGVRLRLFQRQNAELEKKQAEPDPAWVEAMSEWALLAACTTPHITREQYLATPITELQPIMDALGDLNADMFGTGVEQQSKKKTPKSPPKSTSASAT